MLVAALFCPNPALLAWQLVINHNRRWENVQRKLQSAIAAGELGELTSAEVVWPSVRCRVPPQPQDTTSTLAVDQSMPHVHVLGVMPFAFLPSCAGPDGSGRNTLHRQLSHACR